LPGSDPSHWLHRLDAGEWLDAAATELAHCGEALGRRAFRPGVTHARRAAGMALNALLLAGERPRWGRSYMEHVAALADDETVPAEVRAAARLLRDTPPQAPQLIALGKPDLAPLEAARAITAWVRAQLKANG
jgi:HEPN domain-containing protein